METKKLQSFKDLNVWQKSSDLATFVYKITEKFPKSELYGLTNQMRRAVISISSNITEGFKRNHKKEKLQFYSVTYSSTAELESQIEIAYKLDYLPEEDYKKLLSLITEVAKMTDILIKSVRKSLPPKFYILLPFLLLFSISYILIPLLARAATLYLLPQSQTVYRGDSFIVEIRLDTGDEEINALEATLNFPANLLEVIDFSQGGSILNLWLKEPSIINGRISFIGGRAGGFKGEGLILKINFRGKEIGKAEISFKEDSKVLLNDGKGTPAKLSFLEGNYQIISRPEKLPVIFSRSHPDQNKWYKPNTLHLHWDLVGGTEYSFLLSKDPLVEPDEIPDRPEGELVWMGDMEYPDLEDGIYYFHLKQKLPAEDWSEKVTFRAMIDITPPEEFKPEIGQDLMVSEGKYFLSFFTTDKTSGLNYFEVKEGRRDFKRTESPYLLEDQSLRSKISVKAVDRAGNERMAEYIPIKKPLPYWLILSIVIILLIVGWIIFKIIRKKREESGERERYEQSVLQKY